MPSRVESLGLSDFERRVLAWVIVASQYRCGAGASSADCARVRRGRLQHRGLAAGRDVAEDGAQVVGFASSVAGSRGCPMSQAALWATVGIHSFSITCANKERLDRRVPTQLHRD
jgi:hypothetical protein